MNRHQYKDLIIEVLDEPRYKIGSSDNSFGYSKHYFGEEAKNYPASIHGVKVYQDELIVNSCILIGSGGATAVHEKSSLLDSDQLLICCCDTIFCLTLPDLSLKWKTKADQATCFQIYRQQDYYIVHGENQITKLGRNGNKIWEFFGADIFVSIDKEDEFIIEDDGLLLTDFKKTKYKIDFDGRLIWDTKNDT
jgi:outer membrane protein assembly factor BamB